MSPDGTAGSPNRGPCSLPPVPVVAIVAADAAAGGSLALGTAAGVVKRVTPDYPRTPRTSR